MKPLFSTAYFPPIQYVATMLQHHDVLIEVKETYPKQTYRNRMEIMTAGGIMSLTVPVIRNNHSRTEEVLIDYKERWNIIHLRTITAAYSASPYFEYYKDDIEKILSQRYEHLIDLNMATLRWTLNKLKARCVISLTTDWEMPSGRADVYRVAFSPKFHHPTDLKPYYQVFSDRQPFAAGLSTLDLLMNMGPEAHDYLIP